MTGLLEAIARRQIRRICHFTPSRNLGHILMGKRGVLASARLTADERNVFNPTDLERFDRHTGHVCCSVEFPNAWYFRKARGKEPLFLDWSVLLINPEVLMIPGVKFCPRNAAAAGGALAQEGTAGFSAMYETEVTGAGGRVFQRTSSRHPAVPTDEQAEVLVPDAIAPHLLFGVAVSSSQQARVEMARLKILRIEPPPFYIAPQFYDPAALSDAIRTGTVHAEARHHVLEV